MIGTVIDIETTGFLKFDTINGVSQLSDNSEILEVGYINIDMDRREILTYGTLYFYKPYFNIESDAQRVHGLTREFLKQYEQDFEKNLIALNSMIQCTCIIGKSSNSFDIPFINAFIKKHAGYKFDIEDLSIDLNMSAYERGKVHYVNSYYADDMQVLYKDRYHDLFYEKYGYSLMKNKKGKLEEYIDVIPNGQHAVDVIYGNLNKDRVTGAHGALYDAVMTYVVWADGNIAGLF
jgi:DNA polymerase III epsilon subunit-like protein